MNSKLYYTICTIIIGSLPFLLNAQKTNNLVDFLTATTNAGIDIESIKNQSTISRYEVTRILNAVECKDCINPGDEFINKYTKDFRTTFKNLPGKDFDEIDYQGANYKKKSYYYCVASVADNQYMFGYPILSSPACPGLFCGEKQTTNAEFIQVIINILSKYIAKNYQANRNKIKKWKDGLSVGGYQYNIITTDDKNNIDKLSASCSSENCTIENGKDFRTYLKYCMFNLKECNMQTMGRIKQGYWPIAELNIAYREGIIDEINYFTNNIHQPINGDYAISILMKTFPKVSCNFKEKLCENKIDKDCDGIGDDNCGITKDNCLNSYNTNQLDLDKDGIGDVCDGDIDGDGITNPIGIVDGGGSINIQLINSGIDNCIFSVNKNQQDSNGNTIGDACDLSGKFGVAIESRIMGTGNNRKLFATTITSGDNKDYKWTIEYNNQKQYYQGKSILQGVNSGGSYIISVQSEKDVMQKASQTVIINQYRKSSNAEIILSPSKKFLPFILDASIQGKGEGNEVEREISGPIQQSIRKGKNEKRSLVIKNPGKYTIKGIIKEGNTITAIAQKSFIISTTSTDTYTINDNIDTITTRSPFTMSINSPMTRWVVEWGDGSVSDGFSSLINHTYNKGGTFIITSTITLPDNSIITEYKTVVVQSTEPLDGDKILNTRPAVLQGGTYNFVKRINNQNFNTTKLQSIYYNGLSYSTIESESPLFFQGAGIYYPKQIKVLKQCQVVENQSTLVTTDTNSLYCINMSKLKLKPQCDADKDGIDDRCDNDIDGDGINNLIGLITYNTPNCTISKENIDTSKLFVHLQQSCTLDNCPRSSNNTQIDSDQNGIGDSCKTIISTGWISSIILTGSSYSLSGYNNDIDGDGIIDGKDLCPTVKETYNGYEDSDGCPEIGAQNPCNNETNNDYTIGIGECRQCPCQYADDGGDIKVGDKVRASLRDTSGSILQSRSESRFLQ